MTMPAAVRIRMEVRHEFSRVRGRARKTTTAKTATAIRSRTPASGKRMRHCGVGQVPVAQRIATPAVQNPYVVQAAALEKALRRRRGMA